jgi:hypothetical protein
MVRYGDKELLAGAKTIAEDMKLPGGGSAKLARIIDRHLHWFDAARDRGLEWSDIVTMLFNAGVTRPDGRPLSRGHVSSLVWRKQGERKKLPRAPSPSVLVVAKGNGHDEYAHFRKSVRAVREQTAKSAPPSPPSGGPRATPSKNPPTGSAKQKQDVLAFMKRAAAARKR